MKKIVVLLLVFMSFLPFQASAQSGNSVTPVIMELKTFVSSLKAEEKINLSSFSNAQNVEDLVYKLQSSVYFNSGNLKTFGENPKNLYTDINSLEGLLSANFSKQYIELIIINITKNSDLNSSIDLSVFSSFYKLKYVYIVSNVKTNEQALSKMFRNFDEQYGLFYSINLGE